MKRFLTTMVTITMFLAQSVQAGNREGNPTPKSISSQIGILLKNNNLGQETIGYTAEVRFTININDEIVVLSVDSKNSEMDSFLKDRLNYQKIQSSNLQEGKLYIVPVRIKE